MKTAIIVPAYHPTEDMLPMLEKFCASEEFVPVVVNDGSGAEYAPVSARVPEGCVLLQHEVNRGKGAAMKTAMGYILEKLPDCAFAVTADADGQHRYEDVLRVLDCAKQNPHALVLGSRRFDGEVPLRSRLGNAITRKVFSAASGVKVYDTQTGLRAFSRESMEKFSALPGERYEYEINQLLYATRSGIQVREVTIETVYLDDNSASSFHPVRDSLRIYLCILKFVLSSLLAFGVDYVAFAIFSRLFVGFQNSVLALGALKLDLYLIATTLCARIISASVNFTVNKKLVFESKGQWRIEFRRYAVLAIAIVIANIVLLQLLNRGLGVNLYLAKVLVEFVLFVTNFFIQGRLVYARKNK